MPCGPSRVRGHRRGLQLASGWSERDLLELVADLTYAQTAGLAQAEIAHEVFHAILLRSDGAAVHWLKCRRSAQPSCAGP